MDSEQINGFTQITVLLIPLTLKKIYSDSSFINVFVFPGPEIKCILDSGEVIVSQVVKHIDVCTESWQHA